MKQYNKVIFIFRRDLRIVDNTGLLAALRAARCVIPLFILDKSQVGEKNSYRSFNAMQCMYESIMDLHSAINSKGGYLSIVYGGSYQSLLSILKKEKDVDAIFCNRDYTPFARERDREIEQLCIKHDLTFHIYDDYLLHAPDDIVKSDGSPYVKFTPFYKKALLNKVRSVDTFSGGDYLSKPLVDALPQSKIKKIVVPRYNKLIAVQGGRDHGLRLLRAARKIKNYDKTRDYCMQQTTRLSAHLKFGTLSVREVYAYFKEHISHPESLLRQLYWRDFFTQIAYHVPHVFGHAFHKRYDKLEWNTHKSDFNRWCSGETGFPLVDAGMRELNATGYMHNRARMVVASFLVKDLHIDWRWGERYFAQKLVDYDPAVNNGSWQWSASTGCDSQPYFRIFNPWMQQKKYDPDCVYIKHWIPELENIEPIMIHTWYKQTKSISGYPLPMVDHQKEAMRAKVMYKKI